MARRLGWHHLLPGLIVLISLFAIVLGVLTFARVGALHGDTVRLYATMSSARGILRGSEVWLEGQKIGLVESVSFRSVAADTADRVLLKLEILEDVLPQIRRDSYAQVRTGGRLVGANVVYLTIGTIAAPQLTDRDTVRSKTQGDAEELTSQLALAAHQLPEIMRNVKLLSAAVGSASGTIGAMTRPDGSRQLEVFLGSTAGLMRRTVTGAGSVALILRDENTLARARRAAAAADSLRRVVTGSESVVGRFRRDSTLLQAIADVRNEVTIVKALLAEPRGTAGRFVADSAIGLQMSRVERELEELIVDVKRRPFRYIAF